jgi:hypothetical protein
MGRPIDTGWYDTYQQGIALEQTPRAQRFSDPEVAAQLGLKPKTWSRIKIAGRFLDGLTPAFDRARLHCGYAPLERLAKLRSIAPEIAQEVLDAVLSNQLKLHKLEALVRDQTPTTTEHPASRSMRTTASKQALYQQLESFFETSDLHPFDAYKGRVVRRRSTLGAPGGYYLYNAKGQLTCVVMCIQPGAWRDPATAARELYEHALSQRSVAPHVWCVFERANVVLQRLAELSLYWGGSPYDASGHWLFLSHFIDKGHLQVLFEDHFAQLIERIQAGQGLIEKTELFCTLEALDGQPVPEPVPLRPLLDLPKPSKTRSYREVVQERIWAVGNSDSATDLEKRGKLCVDLDL